MTDEKNISNAEENDEADYITLQFEDSEEEECEILGVFDCDGKEYIALLPSDGSDDVYLFEYHEVNEEEFELKDIDDEAEFEKVAAEFEQLSIEEE